MLLGKYSDYFCCAGIDGNKDLNLLVNSLAKNGQFLGQSLVLTDIRSTLLTAMCSPAILDYWEHTRPKFGSRTETHGAMHEITHTTSSTTPFDSSRQCAAQP